MNDILTLDDLSGLIMSKHNMTKDDADNLLKTFLSVIEEGLLYDRYVRIKGFGTFKLIVEDTSNGTLSNRVVFVPDSVLKDAVNKPFSHFEPIVLNENVHFDDIEEQVVSDVSSSSSSSSECNQDDVQEENIEISVCEDTKNAYTENENAENAENNNTEKKDTGKLDETIEQHEGKPLDDKERKGNLEKSYSRVPWCLMLMILIIGLVLGGIVSWLVFDYNIDNYARNVNMIETVTEEPVVESPVVMEDSVTISSEIKEEKNEDVDSVISPENSNVKSSEIKSDVVLDNTEKRKTEFYSEKLKYKIVGTIESHKIEKGNTLVKLAYKYYNNKKMWPYIVKHNKKTIKNPNNVPVGTLIEIPKLEIMD